MAIHSTVRTAIIIITLFRMTLAAQRLSLRKIERLLPGQTQPIVVLRVVAREASQFAMRKAQALVKLLEMLASPRLGIWLEVGVATRTRDRDCPPKRIERPCGHARGRRTIG
jgi:hypothetical protein